MYVCPPLRKSEVMGKVARIIKVSEHNLGSCYSLLDLSYVLCGPQMLFPDILCCYGHYDVGG